MRFVLCANGDLVNLDHVASVTDAANGMQALKGADGRVLGVTAEDTDSMLSQVIPAAGRVTGVILTFDRGEPDKDIRIDRVPVIAWRVYPEGDPTPILASEPLSNQRVLVELPD